MINISSVPAYLFYLVWFVVIWAPGYRELESVEPPKKGYWTVGTVVWPIRRAYRALWPSKKPLRSGLQSALFLAFWCAAISSLLLNFVAGLSARVPPGWYLVELAVVAFLIGRASGFWSADRRVIEAQRMEEAEAKVDAS